MMTLDEDLFSKIINQLPEQKTEVLRLRIKYRFGWSDISKRLNIPEDNCKVIYSRTLQELKNTSIKY